MKFRHIPFGAHQKRAARIPLNVGTKPPSIEFAFDSNIYHVEAMDRQRYGAYTTAPTWNERSIWGKDVAIQSPFNLRGCMMSAKPQVNIILHFYSV